MKWIDELTTGIENIDQQHREIFRQITQLDTDLEEDHIDETIAGIIDFLGEYVTVHFADEERIMRQYQYPDYLAHKAEHAEFLDQFYNSKDLVEAGAKHAKYYLHSIVMNWLEEHIAKSDRALAAFLRERDGGSSPPGT